jgi:hypothetical protein
MAGLERRYHPENEDKAQKKDRFRANNPSKAVVEARVKAKINGASTLPQLKQAVLDVLLGDVQQPGIVDALFDLDR